MDHCGVETKNLVSVRSVYENSRQVSEFPGLDLLGRTIKTTKGQPWDWITKSVTKEPKRRTVDSIDRKRMPYK